jgi:hypothetical protein
MFNRFKEWSVAAMAVTVIASAAFAQDLPKIAVYVTGDVSSNEKDALGTRMLASLVNSGRYMAIERSNAFLAEIDKEHIRQRSGAIDDSQISELGKQFGVKFVCIAAITPAFGDFQVSARIIDVETAVVVFIGESASPLKSMADLARVSDRVVKNMFGVRSTPEREFGADDIFFPSKKGMVLTTAQLNARGKPVLYTRVTVKEATGSGDNMSIAYTAQLHDSKRTAYGRDSREREYTVNVIAGFIELEMKHMENLAAAARGVPNTIIRGGTIRIPSKLAPGVRLENSQLDVTARVAFVKTASRLTMTDIRCVAVENVTVPAGTFEGYKVVQTNVITVKKARKTFTNTTWYVRGIGSVKSVLTNERDKIVSSTELAYLYMPPAAGGIAPESEQDSTPYDVIAKPKNRISLEAGGIWALSPIPNDDRYNNFGGDHHYPPSPVNYGGYLRLDLIYGDVFLELSKYADVGLSVKYPFDLSFVKISPLLGVAYNNTNRSGFFFESFSPFFVGGKLDIGPGKSIYYLRSEFRYFLGPKSGMSLKSGIGYDLGEKFYFRPEFTYGYITSKESVTNNYGVGIGLGYKW